MRRIGIGLAATGAVLALVASAAAKELREIQICGAAACASVTDKATMELLNDRAYSSSKPAVPSEYYTVTYRIDDGERIHAFSLFYIPAGGMLRGKSERGIAEWLELDTASREAFRKATARLAPFAKPTITAARVGGKAVTGDPSSYLSLYAIGSRFHGATRNARWQTIKLESSTPSPWTDGTNRLSYSAKLRLVRRDGQVVRVSKAVSDRIARGLPLG